MTLSDDTIQAMPAAQTTASSPPATTRRRIAFGAAAFLIIQALLPLRYYLTMPTTDERFAWRMFSTTVRKDCTATLYQTVEIDGRLVEQQVPPLMLAPWRHLLNSNRPAAVEKIMKACCMAPNVISVRYKLDCGLAGEPGYASQQLVMDRQRLVVRAITPESAP